MTRNRLVLMTIAVAIGPFIEVMDLLVANVALRHIAGSLSVSTNEATYVVTSYMISNAIVLPMTGWLSQRLGHKRYFLYSVAVFGLASVALAFSQNLTMLIACALVQGLAGGALQPLSQTLLVQHYPREKLGTAMSIWAMTMVTAPAIGPLVGGWITDSLNWRWVFLINLPFCLLCIAMTSAFVPDTPAEKRRQPFDYPGFLLLVVAVGCLQYVLDRGGVEGWFDSPTILTLSLISLVALVSLLIWELGTPYPLLDLSVFGNRAFSLGTLVLGMGYGVFFSSVVLTPLWLQSMMGYSATWAGLALMPTGTVVLLLLLVVAKLMPRVDIRWLVSAGLCVMAGSFFYFSHLTPYTSLEYILFGRILFGIAMVLFFAPISTIVLSQLKGSALAAGAGISGFFRNLSASIGTTAGIAYWDTGSQRSQTQLAEHVQAYAPFWNAYYGTLHDALAQWQGANAHLTATGTLYGRILDQARLLSLVHVFEYAGFLCLAVAALAWAIGPVRLQRR